MHTQQFRQTPAAEIVKKKTHWLNGMLNSGDDTKRSSDLDDAIICPWLLTADCSGGLAVTKPLT